MFSVNDSSIRANKFQNYVNAKGMQAWPDIWQGDIVIPKA